MAFGDFDRDVLPTSVTFSSNAVEISYMEVRDQTQRAGLMKTLIIDVTLNPELVDDLLDAVTDLIDASLLEIRNPEKALRLRAEQEEAPVEEAAEG